MINLGKVKPGSTVEFAFGSFAASTGAPSATTGNATSDIQIYKDGGTTQRASASGVTFTVDYDGLTGVNYISIDLSDNTTADFYAAGSRYTVVVSDVTIDSQTMRFPVGSFVIGLPEAVLDTTIATLASQTSFTLTAGSADNNAYVGCTAYIHDAASGVQCAMGVVSAYTGSTKTVTLAVDPAIFTMAAKDNISILPRTSVYAVGGTAQTARDLGASVLLSTGTGAGQLDFTSGIVKSNLSQYLGNAVPTADTAGYPKVTVKAGTGTGEINLTSGAVPVKGNVKKNTALAAFPFMMTDSTNHAPATGKTVTVTRSIDGGAFGAGTLSAVTEVGVGIYVVDFAAGDLNGNNIILRCTASACDDTFERVITFVA